MYLVTCMDDQLWVIYLVCIVIHVTSPSNTLNRLSYKKTLHRGSKSIQALQDQKNLCKEKKVICVRVFHFSKESLCAILTGQSALRNAQRMAFLQMYILGAAEGGRGLISINYNKWHGTEVQNCMIIEGLWVGRHQKIVQVIPRSPIYIHKLKWNQLNNQIS